LFTRRKFDYCIVDEASQITLPVCLGPLRFADKFVLVGDHFQLPPLVCRLSLFISIAQSSYCVGQVRSRGARKGGLDISLFRRLSDAHPHAVIDLTYQYRMNEDIMLLSNRLIYSDRLRCGSESVAKRTLVIPKPQFLHDLKSSAGDSWIDHLLSERSTFNSNQTEYVYIDISHSCRAVFVDTDLVPAKDSRVGDLVQNEIEATLVCQVTETLLRCGVRQDQIGIISLYRQQIKLLTHLIQDRKEVEILTADRSQGRDKDCIIISLVRSNETGQVSSIISVQ